MVTSRPRVFVSRALPGPALQQLAQHAEVRVWEDAEPPTAQQLQQAVADADGLLCMLTDAIDQTLLAQAPHLHVISSCSVGVDHVDIVALNQRGIPLGHTPHVLVDATADLCFALMLAAARRLPEAEQFLRGGEWTPARRWEPELLLGKDLRGATLGLLGLGAIGQAVAQRAQGFGMRVIGWTPSGRAVAGVESCEFEQVLAEADFLSLHLALSERTRHIINAEALKRLRRDAILINTARGPLIDEAALVEALQAGRLHTAALDVFEAEPIGPQHPLLQAGRVIAVPHIGSATRGTREQMAQRAVDNLLAGLAGRRMPYCANPVVYAGQGALA